MDIGSVLDKQNIESALTGCLLCPRLCAFHKENNRLYPDFWNAPVPDFGDWNASILIIGLAPGLKGANRTGRPFTGDFAGDFLYAALERIGATSGTYSRDGQDNFQLRGVRITNAVHCVPPANKPLPSEVRNCQRYLLATLQGMKQLRTVIVLGRIAHEAFLRVIGLRIAQYPFSHAAEYQLPMGLRLLSSYHCSRMNTNRGVLTKDMFHVVLERAFSVDGQEVKILSDCQGQ